MELDEKEVREKGDDASSVELSAPEMQRGFLTGSIETETTASGAGVGVTADGAEGESRTTVISRTAGSTACKSSAAPRASSDRKLLQ